VRARGRKLRAPQIGKRGKKKRGKGENAGLITFGGKERVKHQKPCSIFYRLFFKKKKREVEGSRHKLKNHNKQGDGDRYRFFPH